MPVEDINITTGKIMGYGICKKKYKISFLGGPTTPTYSKYGGTVKRGSLLHSQMW